MPQRCVRTPDDMAGWQRSCAYYTIVNFINRISQAIQGHRVRVDNTAADLPPAVSKLLGVLDQLDALVDDTPPVQQPQRFGNAAFRDCYAKIKQNALGYLQAALPTDLHRAAVECSFYLVESFGNAVRIDYGTGHELCFVMLLCCLFRVRALDDGNEADLRAAALVLFDRYLRLVRKLQITYKMEPAGSHGVWSLDDYQFVPFIWGSAQLAVKAPLRPAQFLDEDIITTFRDEYMFVGCIEYIGRVKRGNFAEHSPQLWNISGVESWHKINAGLVKMYQKELLAKFPVIQHVLFGSLLEFKPVPVGTLLSVPRLGMLPPASSSHLGKPSLVLPMPVESASVMISSTASDVSTTMSSGAPSAVLTNAGVKKPSESSSE